MLVPTLPASLNKGKKMLKMMRLVRLAKLVKLLRMSRIVRKIREPLTEFIESRHIDLGASMFHVDRWFVPR